MERPKSEERVNAATHAVGILLSLIGCVVLIARLWPREEVWLWIGCSAYGVSLVGVYTSSTLSHCFRDLQRLYFFRRLDQAFIYILIVASYTPFSIAYLNGLWWWGLLTSMWFVAIVGFFSKLIWGYRLQSVSIWGYLILGWMPGIGGMPFTDQLPFECMLWIIMGGVAYSGGTIFLFLDRRRWYFHAIWHLCVLAGSVIHFVAVLKFVLPVE